MRRLLQVMGVLLIVVGVRSLLNSDWVSFGMSSALGVSFLLDPKGDKGLRKLRWLLLLISCVLAVARIANTL
jgi:hypothetical protein